MADAIETAITPAEQASIEMPNGVTLTGMGGDVEAIREELTERHDEREDTHAPAAAPVEAAPKEPRGRKRYGQLTHERDEANRRADLAEAKAKELEAKLATPPVAQPVPAQVAQPAAPVAVADLKPTRTEPTEEEIGTKYATYSAFVKDLAAWTVEQERAKLFTDLDARSTARIEADRASRTRADFVEHIVFPNGRTAYPDFDAVLKATTKLVPFEVQAAILKLAKPEHAIYALAKDDAKIDGLVQVMADPVALGIAVSQLMPRESVASPASTAPVVRTTNVPAPIQPVGAGSRTTSPTLQELADQGRWEEYSKARASGQVH